MFQHCSNKSSSIFFACQRPTASCLTAHLWMIHGSFSIDPPSFYRGDIFSWGKDDGESQDILRYLNAYIILNVYIYIYTHCILYYICIDRLHLIITYIYIYHVCAHAFSCWSDYQNKWNKLKDLAMTIRSWGLWQTRLYHPPASLVIKVETASI